MMDWTDRHCRYFLRQLSPSARLYTEMVTAAALTHGAAGRLLGFDAAEHPVALQLGGSDPAEMAAAAVLGERAGYDEININVGCPSDRVQSGRFGACLMAEPERVAACVRAMRASVAVPVTVKTRTGIDDLDNWPFFLRFVEAQMEAGCTTFIVHARIAVLSGLSPKENRSVPPLNYERVYRLKRHHPELNVVINGGIRSVADAQKHLAGLDGVMIGRAAYQTPYLLAELEHALGGVSPPPRSAVVTAMQPYIERELGRGTRLHQITRHMLGLFAGQPGARAWRRTLSERATAAGAGAGLLEEAMSSAGLAA